MPVWPDTIRDETMRITPMQVFIMIQNFVLNKSGSHGGCCMPGSHEADFSDARLSYLSPKGIYKRLISNKENANISLIFLI